MEKYRFSIIIPIHGVEKYLVACLDSLARQEFNGSYEVICVNDAPNDNSPVICNDFEIKYPHIFKSIVVQNRDLSLTRNAGFKIATGEYVCFLDGDDFVSETYLKDFDEAIRKDDLDIVICKKYIYKDGKNSKSLQSRLTPNGIYKSKKACRRLSNDIGVRGFIGYKCFKKELINDMEFVTNKIVVEDYVYSFIAFSKANKIGFIKPRNLYYVQRNDSFLAAVDHCKILQLIINSLAFAKCYAQSVGKKDFFKCPYLFRRIFIESEIAQLENKTKKEKKLIKKEAIKQLKNIRDHVSYKNTPWEEALKLGNIKDIKEDMEVEFKDLRSI